MLGEELVLPGRDRGRAKVGRVTGHRPILSGRAQLHVRVVLERLAHRPLDLAQRRGSAAGASASGFASASTMKRWASSESANEPASQPAQTTPPAAPEKPARCSASPQRAQEASSGAKPATSASLSRKESAASSPAAARLAGVVEQREVAAEQVVGGRVGLGRVEQAQHRVAGAGAGGQRRAGGAQPRVAVDGGDAGHRHQVAAAFVEDEVEAEERLQAAAEARLRFARPLGDRPEAAPRRRVEVEDAVGLAVADAAQDDRLRLDGRSGHESSVADTTDRPTTCLGQRLLRRRRRLRSFTWQLGQK